MDNVCVPPELIEDVKRIAFNQDGTVKGNSITREKELLELFGDNEDLVKTINLSFEKALISKNKDAAIKRFTEKFTQKGIDKKSEINKKIAEALAERKDKILTKDDFLAIAQQTLKKQKKVDVSLETMQQIQKLKREAVELEKVYNANPTERNQMAWGRKEIEYLDFINEQKGKKDTIGQFFKDTGSRIKEAYKEGGIPSAAGRTMLEVGDTAFSGAFKGVKAAWDMSAPLRQGLKVLTASPSTWAKQTAAGAKVWGKVLNKEALEQASKDFRAKIITDPMYKDMIDSKLRVTGVEDFFPDSPLTRIPFLQNIFKASDQAYTTFVQGARVDLFKNYVKAYELTNGTKPSKEIMEGFARVANSVSGSGGLGRLEPNAQLLNRILFSARYQTANINTLRHAFDSSLPQEARKIAQKNLVKHLAVLGTTLTTASMFGDVGLDPKEKTFGKIRIGDSKKWIDMTGGLASYLVPMFQTADKISDGKPNKYGAESGLDILLGFLQGKLAPAPGALRDILDERTYGNDKITPFSVLSSLVVPITVENAFETYTDEKSRDNMLEKMISVISDGLGASVSAPKAKRAGIYPNAIDIITGNR